MVASRCVCVFVGRGDEEALPHVEQPVQALSGDADADAQRLSAVLRSLHQTQRAEKADGEFVCAAGARNDQLFSLRSSLSFFYCSKCIYLHHGFDSL